ncbi:MAG TPA: SRPBCC family protein, partial [Nocardioides sp.]|nr:SRPBCC family protein [Nocardioides sp.]
PSFMKKVETVDAVEDQKLHWKAQILWSHREWESTIVDQIPDERIVWRSKGSKGYVDGAVTFHELTPDLTRIILVLEYHPQGLFERTGNLWRAQARRVRAELQHFRRHVMAHAVLAPDEVEGWRGTIEDAEVVESHEDAVAEEDEESQGDQPEDEYDEGEEPDEHEPEDDEEPEDEYDELEDDEDPEDEEEPEEEDEEEPEDEYEDEDEDEDDEEYEEDEEVRA